MIDGRTIFERLVQISDVDHMEALVPGLVAETAFGDAAEERHLPPLKSPTGHVGAGAGILSLAPARGGLAMAAANAATSAFLPFAAVCAVMQTKQIHVTVPPPGGVPSLREFASPKALE